jgi:hypothetical protein
MKYDVYLSDSQPRLFRDDPVRSAATTWLMKGAALVLLSAAILALSGCKDAAKSGATGMGAEPPALSTPPSAPPAAAEPAPAPPAANAPMDGASAPVKP